MKKLIEKQYPRPNKLYNIDNDTAYWPEDAEDFIYWHSEADKWAEDYAKSYKVKMSPKDYLDLTTVNGADSLKVGDDLSLGKLEPLDIERFNKETYQNIFLQIAFRDDNNPNVAQVVGHEGRHRMFALMNAGVKSVDVELMCDTYNTNYKKYNPFILDHITLIGQFNKSVRVRVDNPIAMSWKKHKEIRPNLTDEGLVEYLDTSKYSCAEILPDGSLVPLRSLFFDLSTCENPLIHDYSGLIIISDHELNKKQDDVLLDRIENYLTQYGCVIVKYKEDNYTIAYKKKKDAELNSDPIYINEIREDSDFTAQDVMNDIEEYSKDYIIEGFTEISLDDYKARSETAVYDGIITESGKILIMDDTTTDTRNEQSDIYFTDYHPLIIINQEPTERQYNTLGYVIGRHLKDLSYCKFRFDKNHLVIFENYDNAAYEDTGEGYEGYEVHVADPRKEGKEWVPSQVISYIKDIFSDTYLEGLNEKLTKERVADILSNKHNIDESAYSLVYDNKENVMIISDSIFVNLKIIKCLQKDNIDFKTIDKYSILVFDERDKYLESVTEDPTKEETLRQFIVRLGGRWPTTDEYREWIYPKMLAFYNRYTAAGYSDKYVKAEMKDLFGYDDLIDRIFKEKRDKDTYIENLGDVKNTSTDTLEDLDTKDNYRRINLYGKTFDIDGEALYNILQSEVQGLSRHDAINAFAVIFSQSRNPEVIYSHFVQGDRDYFERIARAYDEPEYKLEFHEIDPENALKACDNEDMFIESKEKRTIEDVSKADVQFVNADNIYDYYNNVSGNIYYNYDFVSDKYRLLDFVSYEDAVRGLKNNHRLSLIFIPGAPIDEPFSLKDLEDDSYVENLEEKLLLEKTRNQLIDKSKKSDNYSKKNQGKGRNRWERRVHSRIANTVRDYNKIDMDAFFKADILDFIIKVQGETNDYEVQITFEEALREIARQIKSNNNKLEFKCVLRGLISAFNRGNVYVSCSCLHPDTKIKLLDGTTPTVKEMKDRFDSGEQLYVYSTDIKGDFKPGIVEKVWITKQENKLIKVTLDNNESITTTLDHPYMLRDGTYVLAEDLSVGQSLMPMYFNYSAKGYQGVKFNSEERGWHSVYKLVADYFKANEINEAKLRIKEDDNMSYDVAIHHRDFNKNNNNPENLQIMTAREHWDYHSSLCGKNRPVTDRQREVSRQNAIKRNANPTSKMIECRNNFIKKGHESAQFRNHDAECIKKQSALMRETMKNYYSNISEEQLSEIKIKRAEGIKKAFERGCFNTEKYIIARHKAFNMDRTPEFKLYQQRCKIGKVIQKILNNSEIPSPETYEKYRSKGYPKFTSGFNNWDELNSYFSLNHKITSIEYIMLDEPIDVYDIKVKDWENFVVDAGVVLHNCPDWKYRQAYWSTKGQYNSGTPQPDNGKAIANPNDTKGGGCKHVNLCLANLDWMMKIASVVNNYIYWARDNLELQYAKFIFPQLFGMPYDRAIQMTIDMYDEYGELKPEYQDDRLKSSEDIINMSNMIGKQRGQYKKKPAKSINPRYSDLHPKKEEPEEETNELGLDLDNEEPEFDIDNN